MTQHVAKVGVVNLGVKNRSTVVELQWCLVTIAPKKDLLSPIFPRFCKFHYLFPHEFMFFLPELT